MIATVDQNGKFTGTVYQELTQQVIDYHEQNGFTYVVVSGPLENIGTDEEPDYGEPTAAQKQEKINAEARAYLASTDWYVIRYQETGVAVPQEVLTARQEARAKIVAV